MNFFALVQSPVTVALIKEGLDKDQITWIHKLGLVHQCLWYHITKDMTVKNSASNKQVTVLLIKIKHSEISDNIRI